MAVVTFTNGGQVGSLQWWAGRGHFSGGQVRVTSAVGVTSLVSHKGHVSGEGQVGVIDFSGGGHFSGGQVRVTSVEGRQWVT